MRGSSASPPGRGSTRARSASSAPMSRPPPPGPHPGDRPAGHRHTGHRPPRPGGAAAHPDRTPFHLPDLDLRRPPAAPARAGPRCRGGQRTGGRRHPPGAAHRGPGGPGDRPGGVLPAVCLARSGRRLLGVARQRRGRAVRARDHPAVVVRTTERSRESYAGWKQRTAALPHAKRLVLDHRHTDRKSPAHNWRCTATPARSSCAVNRTTTERCCGSASRQASTPCCGTAPNTASTSPRTCWPWSTAPHHTEYPSGAPGAGQGRRRAGHVAHHGLRLSLLYDAPDHRPPTRPGRLGADAALSSAVSTRTSNARHAAEAPGAHAQTLPQGARGDRTERSRRTTTGSGAEDRGCSADPHRCLTRLPGDTSPPTRQGHRARTSWSTTRSPSSTRPCTCAARCWSPAAPAPASRSLARAVAARAGARPACCAGPSTAAPRSRTASTATTPSAGCARRPACSAGPRPTAATGDIGSYRAARPAGHRAGARATGPGCCSSTSSTRATSTCPTTCSTVFEEGEFEIPELARLPEEQPDGRRSLTARRPASGSPSPRGRVRCRAFPVVVITSNGERDFPPAFLRRCVRLDLPEPDDDRLRQIVEHHLGEHRRSAEAEDLDRGASTQRAKTQTLATDQLFAAVHLRISGADLTKEELLAAVLHRLDESMSP